MDRPEPESERLIMRETEGQTDSKGDWATLYIYNNHKQRMDWRALCTLHTFQLRVRWSRCSHYTL